MSIPRPLSVEVDRQAEVEGRTRSELVREALRQYLGRRDRWERIFAYGERLAARLEVDEQDVVRAVRADRQARGEG